MSQTSSPYLRSGTFVYRLRDAGTPQAHNEIFFGIQGTLPEGKREALAAKIVEMLNAEAGAQLQPPCEQLLVGIRGGRFYLQAQTETLCDATLEDLTNALVQVGLTAKTVVVCSSSLDFPEDAGAPEDLRPRAMLRSAMSRAIRRGKQS